MLQSVRTWCIEEDFCLPYTFRLNIVVSENESVDAGGVLGVSGGALKNVIAELSSSIPGIDEAMSFAELMQQVQV